ncbi:hypothetical protein BD410DRAFT_783902 [Rickenella mellea]|uniref:Uncharacterized protein n=1 Tax=Rickenella mellea TaxID=50990 RepID=A0A4Y7QEZ3_9AGAM|nr:hypothetical protein BD410DRAFT_783902 [Rickenella mellea]
MSSHRLESTRNRPPPPPLRLTNSPFRPTSPSGNDQQLLYDLPSSSAVPSPTKSQFLTSPTSPSFQSRTRADARARRTPPPPLSNRSVTPQPGNGDELDRFGDLCRSWYYDQEDMAGREMTKILAMLPPSQRAQYTRLQSSIRASYHANLTAQRRAEFQAHLSATQSGGSLMPHSRAHPSSKESRRERHGRLERFIHSWCNMGMPGTKPFFEALWAVLRLQVIPEHLGGSGNRRIEWEFDDAVFMESAGKDFMLEAIDVLKGVLGFEETRAPRRSRSFRISKDTSSSAFHLRSQSEPLSPKPPVPPRRNKPVINSSTTMTSRPRAPSDPFLDAPSSSRFHVNEESHFMPSNTSELNDDESNEDEGSRIWTSPDLPNPELISLLGLFPSFVSRQTLPRFSVATAKRRPADLEEVADEMLNDGRDEVRFGTGVMWIGIKERADGWQGGWWERFVAWWRRVFC